MKYEPSFKALQGNPAFFWVRASRGPFHVRQNTPSPSHIPISEGRLFLRCLWKVGLPLHPTACGILADEGSNPCRPHWQADSLLLKLSHSIASDFLRPHGLQHARLPCPSPIPRACSNSCPSSHWCHPTMSSPVDLFSCLQSSPLFSSKSDLHIRWAKYWSFNFSVSPSSGYSGLISFRIFTT